MLAGLYERLGCIERQLLTARQITSIEDVPTTQRLSRSQPVEQSLHISPMGSRACVDSAIVKNCNDFVKATSNDKLTAESDPFDGEREMLMLSRDVAAVLTNDINELKNQITYLSGKVGQIRNASDKEAIADLISKALSTDEVFNGLKNDVLVGINSLIAHLQQFRKASENERSHQYPIEDPSSTSKQSKILETLIEDLRHLVSTATKDASIQLKSFKDEMAKSQEKQSTSSDMNCRTLLLEGKIAEEEQRLQVNEKEVKAWFFGLRESISTDLSNVKDQLVERMRSEQLNQLRSHSELFKSMKEGRLQQNAILEQYLCDKELKLDLLAAVQQLKNNMEHESAERRIPEEIKELLQPLNSRVDRLVQLTAEANASHNAKRQDIAMGIKSQIARLQFALERCQKVEAVAEMNSKIDVMSSGLCGVKDDISRIAASFFSARNALCEGLERFKTQRDSTHDIVVEALNSIQEHFDEKFGAQARDLSSVIQKTFQAALEMLNKKHTETMEAFRQSLKRDDDRAQELNVASIGVHEEIKKQFNVFELQQKELKECVTSQNKDMEKYLNQAGATNLTDIRHQLIEALSEEHAIFQKRQAELLEAALRNIRSEVHSDIKQLEVLIKTCVGSPSFNKRFDIQEKGIEVSAVLLFVL